MARINARLDKDLAAKIEEIRRQTGMTITEIVEAALVAWTTQGPASTSGPARAFATAGFIGSGTGPRNLARDAKRSLRRTLRSKT
ncbi:MAG: ribbon-helix-helix domain-containing protein [Kofleriaceae bacterium]